MAYAEFVEWMAFVAVEPLPQARADLHTALLMYLIASTNRKKGDKRLKLEKFVLDFWASSSRDPRALERKFRAMTGNAETADSQADSPPPASSLKRAASEKEVTSNGRRA